MLLGHEIIRYRRALVSYCIPNRPTYTIFVLSRPQSKELVFSESLGFHMKRWFGGTFNGRGLSRQPGIPLAIPLLPLSCAPVISCWFSLPRDDLSMTCCLLIGWQDEWLRWPQNTVGHSIWPRTGTTGDYEWGMHDGKHASPERKTHDGSDVSPELLRQPHFIGQTQV